VHLTQVDFFLFRRHVEALVNAPTIVSVLFKSTENVSCFLFRKGAKAIEHDAITIRNKIEMYTCASSRASMTCPSTPKRGSLDVKLKGSTARILSGINLVFQGPPIALTTSKDDLPPLVLHLPRHQAKWSDLKARHEAPHVTYFTRASRSLSMVLVISRWQILPPICQR